MSLNRVLLYTAAFTGAALISAFRMDEGTMRLIGVKTSTDRTVISYHENKSVSSLLTMHNSSDGVYTTTRIPVYENGRLVKMFITDEESTSEPRLFSSFDYSDKQEIIRISYYLNKNVHAYDSLVYNSEGRVVERYYFDRTRKNAPFTNNSCQHYNWDRNGNIVSVDNMGKPDPKLPFTHSSTTLYQYDGHPNIQRSIPLLAYLVDVAAINLSANNIVSETIQPANGGRAIVNRYKYAYKNKKYPSRVTAIFSGNEGSVITELEWSE